MSGAQIARRSAFALLTSTAVARTGEAQPSLDRLARIVVGAAPGGGADLVARVIADRLNGRYAPQVIVENRPGASSRLAPEAVRLAAPDGTTILLGPMPVLTLFPHTLPRTTRYDTLADFTPVTTVGELAYGFVVRADHPARDLRGFLDWARARGHTTFAPPVVGTPQHMLGMALAREAAVEFTLVPYRDNTGVVADLLGGRLDCHMSHMAFLSGHAREGRVRLLAVSSEARLTGFPDAPTFAEQGYPNLTASEAFSVMLPARAPEPIVSALHAAVDAAVAEPATRERLLRMEITPMVLTPASTASRIRNEFAAWRPLVQASGFRAEE